MKTQIFRRTFLAVVALFICFNNYSNKTQLTKASSTITIQKAQTAITNDLSESTTCICCKYCSDEHAVPIIPEPNGDHEFHSFHVKDKHSKHINFLKNIASKMIEVFYYLIVLIVYMPFKH